MAKTGSTKKTKISTKDRSSRKSSKSSKLKKYLFSFLLIVIVFSFIFLESYRIPSRSMEDTLFYGDLILIESFTPFVNNILDAFNIKFGMPNIGDLIVFEAPDDSGKIYIKRCLAKSGQVVEIVAKIPYVDGKRALDPIQSKYLDSKILSQKDSSRDYMFPSEVPQRSIFVLGDNRDNSRDSRHWGTVPRESIIGYPMFVYASLSPEKLTDASIWDEVIHFIRRIRWSRILYRIY